MVCEEAEEWLSSSSRHGSAQSTRRLRVRDREALFGLVQQFLDAPSESVILLSVTMKRGRNVRLSWHICCERFKAAMVEYHRVHSIGL